MNNKFAKNNKGFTLIELLVSIGIFIIVLVGMANILIFAFQARDVMWEQLKTQSEGRMLIQNFVNELRSATQSSIGSHAIKKADKQEIIFYSNIDNDNLRERVRYFLDGTDFKKGVIKPTGTQMLYMTSTEAVGMIIHDVIATSTTQIFNYYDENYTGTEDPLSFPIQVMDIRIVEIDLFLEKDPNFSPKPLQIKTKAHIRNLKTN